MSHHAVSRRVVRRGMSRHAVRCRVAPRRVIPDGNGGIDGNGVTASRVRQKPRRLDRYATARRSSTRRARSAARRRAARRRAPRAAAADAEEARGQLRAPKAKISARTPTRSQKPRRRDRAAQLDAPRPSRSPTRRGSTPRAACGRRRCRRSQRPVGAYVRAQHAAAGAGGPPRTTELASSEQARRVRSGPSRELRRTAPEGREGRAPSLHLGLYQH